MSDVFDELVFEKSGKGDRTLGVRLRRGSSSRSSTACGKAWIELLDLFGDDPSPRVSRVVYYVDFRG